MVRLPEMERGSAEAGPSSSQSHPEKKKMKNLVARLWKRRDRRPHSNVEELLSSSSKLGSSEDQLGGLPRCKSLSMHEWKLFGHRRQHPLQENKGLGPLPDACLVEKSHSRHFRSVSGPLASTLHSLQEEGGSSAGSSPSHCRKSPQDENVASRKQQPSSACRRVCLIRRCCSEDAKAAVREAQPSRALRGNNVPGMVGSSPSNCTAAAAMKSASMESQRSNESGHELLGLCSGAETRTKPCVLQMLTSEVDCKDAILLLLFFLCGVSVSVSLGAFSWLRVARMCGGLVGLLATLSLIKSMKRRFLLRREQKTATKPEASPLPSPTGQKSPRVGSVGSPKARSSATFEGYLVRSAWGAFSQTSVQEVLVCCVWLSVLGAGASVAFGFVIARLLWLTFLVLLLLEPFMRFHGVYDGRKSLWWTYLATLGKIDEQGSEFLHSLRHEHNSR